MTVAFVFPGQGSQSVGMVTGLLETSAPVAAAFAEAGEALGFDLTGLVRSGPEERLQQTVYAQPALLAAGVAVYRAWQAEGGAAPACMAGHSLGEYTALVCAEALPFADALRLVRRRGELMQQAVAAGEGAMAAILGLRDEQVRAICEQTADDGIVEAVNFNAPGQVVVAGHRAAIERAVERAMGAGARRAVVLPVSVPAHCALMRPAADGLADALRAVPLAAPRVPVINNVDVRSVADPEALRDALVRQLYSPVRWAETIEAMRRQGVRAVVECGPGKVLAGLIKRIDRSLEVHALTDTGALAAAVKAVSAGANE